MSWRRVPVQDQAATCSSGPPGPDRLTRASTVRVRPGSSGVRSRRYVVGNAKHGTLSPRGSTASSNSAHTSWSRTHRSVTVPTRPRVTTHSPVAVRLDLAPAQRAAADRPRRRQVAAHVAVHRCPQLRQAWSTGSAGTTHPPSTTSVRSISSGCGNPQTIGTAGRLAALGAGLRCGHVDPEPLGHGGSADLPHQVGVADDDQLVGGARHADVELLPRPVARLRLVDAEHDRRPLEALAAEDVAVEDLVVPVRPPVAELAVVVGPLDLHRVPRPGGEQRDAAGVPADVEQQVDRVVGTADGIPVGREERDVRALATPRRHPGRRQRPERLVDLAGVAEVVRRSDSRSVHGIDERPSTTR